MLDSPSRQARTLSRRTALAVAAAPLLGACGYRIAGQADTLPDTIQTIAIPPVRSATTEFKIEQMLTSALTREFITRTRYHVVTKRDEADATLDGTVIDVRVYPVIFDPRTGRATAIATLTRVQVSLWNQRTGQLLYQNPNFEYRERYEVSTDADAYFEERQVALQRTSEGAARDIVSAVLEGF